MMPSVQRQRVEWISALFCWSMLMVNGPWMVNGGFSCYSGTVDIINGELNVASTSSIVLQQCSEPSSTSPSTLTTEVNSTVPLATAQRTPNTTVSGNETTPTSTTGSRTAGGLTTLSMAPQLTPNTTLTASNESTTAAVTPEATNGMTTATPGAAIEANSTVTPSTTNGTTTAPEGPIIATVNTTATNGTTEAPPVSTPDAISATGSSVVGCVVTTSYWVRGSKNNLTASFSCPAPNSPCGGIGFNGSTGSGAENQTECCVGALCNTLDSFIMKENISYSTVDSCFVGSTDAIETPCGNSSNMCLTITETIQNGNSSYYCGNDTLQSYCEQDGALREGSFKQEDKNVTVRCCGTTNCNTPTLPSTPTAATPSMATPMSTTGPLSTAGPPSTGTPSSAGTPLPPFTPLVTATGSSSMATSGSTAVLPSTGAPKTSSEPAAPAMHSNKTLIIGIVAAFVVGLLGGVIVTVICCRRRKNSAARPGELLAFDSFHYKRMGADEVNEEVFMS